MAKGLRDRSHSSSVDKSYKLITINALNSFSSAEVGNYFQKHINFRCVMTLRNSLLNPERASYDCRFHYFIYY
jgi:hypothetical protein